VRDKIETARSISHLFISSFYTCMTSVQDGAAVKGMTVRLWGRTRVTRRHGGCRPSGLIDGCRSVQVVTNMCCNNFADALEARLAGTERQKYEKLMGKRTSDTYMIKAYRLFIAACRFATSPYYFMKKLKLS
jgi:hypothetical protein